MDVFTMVVVIVTVSCVAGVLNNFLKTKRATHDQAPAEDLVAEIDALKERVAVLEEIVTDDRYRLDRELNRLG